jgi:hypothetical protein
LNATVNPRGQSTSYAFQYGTTTAYGSQVPATAAPAGSGSSPVPVSAGLTGVARGTTIHYRVVATNADGASVGGDRTFTTLDPPVATTGDAGAVTASSATLTGSVNPRGKATTFRFEYGTSTAYGSEVTGSAGSSTAAVSLATQVAGLTADTVYHFRLSATNADGTTVGSDGTFKTAVATGTGTTGTTGGTAGTTGTTGTTGTGDGGSGGLATTPPLAVTVAVVRAKLARALSNGLRVRAGCARVCNLSVKLVLPAKVAKKLRLKRTVGSTRRSSGPTPATVTVRFSKKARAALSRLRRVSLSVVVTATSADGARATATKRLTLRR